MTRHPMIGLALGGGGARGLAHIGVLRVLEQERIPIDIMAGTSMGGLLACAYARGMSPDAMQQEAARFSGTLPLVRLMAPEILRRGVFGVGGVDEWLESIFGGFSFGDLRIRTAVVAVDLVSQEEVVLREGAVAPAVRATISLPGFFAPVEMDGRVLVDGGLLNNVPADVARSMGTEVLIAVSVSGDYSAPPEAREIIRLPLPGQAREVIDVLYQSLGVMMRHLTRSALQAAKPEVLIQPPLPADLSVTTGFARYLEAIDAGEAAARAAMPQIREALDRASHESDP